MDQFESVEITAAATTTLIKANATNGESLGMIGIVTILKADAHTIDIYDGDASTGTKIATIPVSLATGSYFFYRVVTKGLTVVTQAAYAGDVVISFVKGPVAMR